jgi:hypothetical protein
VDLIDNDIGAIESPGDITVDFDKFTKRRQLIVKRLKEESPRDILTIETTIEMRNYGHTKQHWGGHACFRIG